MNVKILIMGALIIEGLFLFFTTIEEQKLNATRATASSHSYFEDLDMYTYKGDYELTKRVEIDLNTKTKPTKKVKYKPKPVLHDCPEEFVFELYSYLDEAPSRRKNWNYEIKNGLFEYKNKKLTSIPISVTEEPCFSGLDFSINRLTVFPSELGAVTNLKSLNLSYNRITKIEHFGKFPNLDYLDLSSNKITEIGDEIAALKNLRHLNLKSNYSLENISTRIFVLKNTLKVLNIKNTKFAKNKQAIQRLQENLPDTKVIY